MKKILFIVNGAGLGNATRCDAIIEELVNSFDITVICSGNSYNYLKPNKKLTTISIRKIIEVN
jgi:predicted glycosyltransferase